MFKEPKCIELKGTQHKHRWGRRVPADESYVFTGRLYQFYGHTWHIFAKPADTGSTWMNFRLSVVGSITGRANYKLGWNGERFAETYDLRALKEKRPKLFQRFCEWLKDEGYIDGSYEETKKE
jgi:hypothetical protein